MNNKEIEDYEMNKKVNFTQRGFEIVEFIDSNQERYDLQQSSAAEENYIWIFPCDKKGDRIDGVGIHLNEKDAKLLADYLVRYFENNTFMSEEEQKEHCKE